MSSLDLRGQVLLEYEDAQGHIHSYFVEKEAKLVRTLVDASSRVSRGSVRVGAAVSLSVPAASIPHLFYYRDRIGIVSHCSHPQRFGGLCVLCGKEMESSEEHAADHTIVLGRRGQTLELSAQVFSILAAFQSPGMPERR